MVGGPFLFCIFDRGFFSTEFFSHSARMVMKNNDIVEKHFQEVRDLLEIMSRDIVKNIHLISDGTLETILERVKEEQTFRNKKRDNKSA